VVIREIDVLTAECVDDRCGKHRRRTACGDAGGDALGGRSIELGRRADRCPGEHQAEQQEHDNRADIDENLYPCHELRREQQETTGDGAKGDDEP
jgi:hypothetical protein